MEYRQGNRTQADAERFVAFDNRVVCHRDHDVLLFPGGADEGQGAGQQAGDVTGFGVARADRVIDREATFDGDFIQDRLEGIGAGFFVLADVDIVIEARSVLTIVPVAVSLVLTSAASTVGVRQV